MKKCKISLFLVWGLFNLQTYSQTNPRLVNTQYMQTVFFEDFLGTSVNRSVWDVANDYKRELGVLIDSPQTLGVNNGKLELKMLYSPGYDAGIYSGDYICAEISSKPTFRYGSFECLAKFAHEKASWPAFWIIGGDGTPCPPGGYGNEIDIAEFKCDDSDNTLDHVIHRYYPPANCDDSYHIEKDFYAYHGMNFDNNYHLFKCIWTPDKIVYYVDGIQTHQVFNSGQEWYPNLYLSVILSQQVVDPIGAPIAPQTSYFDNVRVKQFFLAPKITCPNVICSADIATMDVDQLATNISWQLTPSSLFTTTSGTGKTANIVRSSGASGLGKITYTFQMPSGETFTAESDFWVGDPNYTFHVSRPDGYPVTNDEYGDLTFCPHTNYELWIDPGLVHCYTGNEVWDIPSEWTVNYINGNRMSINTNDDPNKTVSVEAVNTCCGSTVNISYTFGNSTTCDLYLLTITPNPSVGETTLSIGSKTAQKVDALIEWDLEVYDSMQALKIKTQKIKGDKKIINTSGWKDGVYIARAKVGDILLSEKLVVKH